MISFNLPEIGLGSRLLTRLFLGARPGVAISFDDAYVNEWYSLRGLFSRYGAKATFFVSNFDLLPEESIERLRILQDDGHEIAFHGLRHVSAGKFVSENSLDKYLESEIFPGIDTMKQSGFSPLTFSYPYGVRAPHIDEALLKYFKHIRGVACTQKSKKLSGLSQIYYKRKKGLVFAAGVDNVYGKSLEEIKDAMKMAVVREKTILLYAHKTSDEACDYCTPVSRMEALIEYASNAGLKFFRIKDL